MLYLLYEGKLMSTVTLSVAPTPPRAGRREWFGLAVLFLPTLLVAIDNTVLGFALARYVLRVPPLVAMSREDAQTWLGPTLRHYLLD